MKKIINGKLYNTQSATLLASYDNRCLPNDFRYVEEALYRKKTGEFFLYAYGGPMSIYAESLENCSRGSERIIPMSESEAREWAEAYADADKYMEIFGEVEE